MLLTRKNPSGTAAGAAPSALVAGLARGAARALPTMDRRAFLRRQIGRASCRERVCDSV